MRITRSGEAARAVSSMRRSCELTGRSTPSEYTRASGRVPLAASVWSAPVGILRRPVSDLTAIVLAGGSGTRFWPVSRRDRPKQLLALDGERTLLQATVDRLAPLVPAERVWVCTGERLAEQVRAQLPEVPAAQVLSEPEG